MEKINLKAKIREELGKEAVKKLRHQGFIPAVVYKGKNCLNIKVSSKELSDVIHTKAGENVVVNLQIEGHRSTKGKEHTSTKEMSKTVVIKEIQYHPVREQILHVDFNEISLTEVLVVKVPIAVKGEPRGSKEGGVLEHVLWEVEIECLPAQIPENISIDVSSLNIGDSILVKDLQIPQGLKVLSDLEATVVTLAAPRVEEAEVLKPEEEMVEPEVIMEKKPKEEEASVEEGEKAAKPEKEKKQKE